MLRIARTKLERQPVPVDLLQGDFLELPVADASIDSIVIHQALHFAHEPDRVIAEASRVLRGGGHLLVVDFAPHEDEELRALAAHARLGFSDAQIRGWFASAGLRSEEHTSELQSLMRISYAVFCLKQKKKTTHLHNLLFTY